MVRPAAVARISLIQGRVRTRTSLPLIREYVPYADRWVEKMIW